ncbi:hypothetical protein EXIGLDRAFT_772669, partial [Exidia glandulosa HHB12029]
VKRGIIALLEKRRCTEELERVEAEVSALGAWWADEERKLETFQQDVGGWKGVAVSASRRLLVHRRQRNIWERDLTHTDRLLVLLKGAIRRSAASAAEPPAVADGPDADELKGSVPDGAEATDIDSDDASDAYSSGEDEDDPLAELLDELEGAAVDLQEGPDAAPMDVEGAFADVQAVEQAQPVSSADVPQHGSTLHAAITILDSDDDDTTTQPVAARTIRPKYSAGMFSCDDVDLERVCSATAWLSGDGIAVFLQKQLMEQNLDDISIVHSRVLHDITLYELALQESEIKGAQYRAPIESALATLVSPSLARKWLILGHVPSPPHWTLLEIRWAERTVFFYDSFARRGGYELDLDRATRRLLRICEEYFRVTLDGDSFTWVGERRRARQTNSWDCGPFVAADACSLLQSDMPSDKAAKQLSQIGSRRS